MQQSRSLCSGNPRLHDNLVPTQSSWVRKQAEMKRVESKPELTERLA